VVIDYTCTAPLRTAIFGVTISRDDGVVCFESNTVASGVSACGGYTLDLDSVNLNTGLYCFDIGAYQAAWEYAFDYHWHAYQLRVRSQPTERGLMTLGHRWHAKDVNPESQ
jgi:lipopolysaccharide transport system ATP-binding protein